MSPERPLVGKSRVQNIIRKFNEKEMRERAHSANDLTERGLRLAHAQRDVGNKRYNLRKRDDKTVNYRTTTETTVETYRPLRTILHVTTKFVARSLLIGFWWLLLLIWWIVALFPRCLCFIFIKGKRKNKDEVERSGKKSKATEKNQVRQCF